MRVLRRASPPVTGPAPPAGGRKQFGTFAGVFTPTVLTILGVIMFLRLGWVVGNAGLLGGSLIILVALGVTLATGLSLSSIATNTRLGAGGPYAIISRSLGLEIGGSVGIPLYLSQALAVSMYIFGFREGWAWMYPDHPALLVDLVVFLVVFVIAYLSAELAFKIQYLVMAVIALSLVSIFASPAGLVAEHPITWWGQYPGSPENAFTGASFWTVFAVFFPAATGIMAGANMSGELRNPRISIPLGTLAAIAVSSVVYLALAVWLARAATPEELVGNYTIMIDKSLWGPAVVAGLLGATFSSALTSLVGAPRILAALGSDGILPRGQWVAQTSPSGEPRRGMMITGAIVLVGLMMRDLNLIAPLITMFFLITYAVINVVILVETSLGLVSFRPTMRLPLIVPLAGATGCVFAMFIVNPTFSLVAVGLVTAMYGWMLKTGVGSGKEDVRSGIFGAMAEWAAARVMELQIMTNVRAWKPSVLVPVQDPARLRGEFRLLVDLCRPEGSVKILGLATRETVGDLTPRIRALATAFQKHRVFTTSSVIDSTDALTGVVAGLQALGSAFFRPNIVFLSFSSEEAPREQVRTVLEEARRLQVSAALLALHPKAGMGREKVVNLWLRPQDPDLSGVEGLARSNLNLSILFAYRLSKAWDGDLNLICVVPEEDRVEGARRYVEELRDLCRIPRSAQTHVLTGNFLDAIAEAPQSDLDLMGLQEDPDLDFVAEMVRRTRSSCLFTSDSGNESALA